MAKTDIRDGMIHNAQQERMTRDTLIMQKVNGAHREAFKTRFPGQIEHCMRLTAERLQAVLTKKPKDLTNPENMGLYYGRHIAFNTSVTMFN